MRRSSTTSNTLVNYGSEPTQDLTQKVSCNERPGITFAAKEPARDLAVPQSFRKSEPNTYCVTCAASTLQVRRRTSNDAKGNHQQHLGPRRLRTMLIGQNALLPRIDSRLQHALPWHNSCVRQQNASYHSSKLAESEQYGAAKFEVTVMTMQ